MKRIKSSLGKRSSSIGGFNSHNSDINASNLTSTNKKKSFIPQPGFISRKSRSNSVDTLNDVGHERSGRRDSKLANSIYSSAKKPMQRSKSQANLMTPCTPGNNMSYMPPSTVMGSAKSVRSKMSMDSRERMSSMGARITKKDTRPINDKNFIQEMTGKVQRLASLYPECKDLMSHGKIRPMSTPLFIILSEIVLQYFDHQVVLNNANYATEIPNIAKIFLYRGKLDRTMLITVSTPHTYPNVIAFLGWFVECQDMAKALNFELLFNRFIEESAGEQEDEDDDYDFAVLIPHLAKCYNYVSKNKSCAQLDAEFSVELKQRSNHQFDDDKERDDERELQELASILENMEAEDEVRDQEIDAMDKAVAMLTKDVQKKETYICQTDEYIENVKSQTERVAQELKKTESKMEEVSKEIQYLNLAVKNQELSLEDKEKLAHERNEIVREINLLEAQTKSFSDILYMEQIEVSKQRSKVDANILEYNRDLYEHLDSLPNAQELTIGTNILDPAVLDQHSKVDTLLDVLVTELASRPEELEDKLATVQETVAKRDKGLKGMGDALVALNERNALATARIKEKRVAFENELDRLQEELKSVEREMEIVSMQQPNVLEVEKQLAAKRQQLEAMSQSHRKNVERMKQRILFVDNEYRVLVEALQESNNRITTKRKVLSDLMNVNPVN